MATSSPVFASQAQLRNGFSYSPASRSPTAPVKRRRSSTDDFDDDVPHENGAVKVENKSKHSRGAPKRACNECRQQKLRCDVQEQPSFRPCTRCEKQNLHCSIDENFKRVAKRSRVADLERHNQDLQEENAQLRKQLEDPRQQNPFAPQPPALRLPDNTTAGAAQAIVGFSTEHDKFMGKNLAAASLLDLRSGSPGLHSNLVLGKVQITPDQAQELYNEYFLNYHQYLPFLDPQQSAQYYIARSQSSTGIRLLCWAIITTAARHYEADKTLINRLKQPLVDLVWDVIRKLPQDYHVVKALAIICSWPIPTSRTTTDPTNLFCGNMINLAKQLGLHKPQHAQDFSREKLHLQREDVEDRLKTWVVCNIVAQRVSTGYGHYPSTLWELVDLGNEDTDVAKVIGPELYAMAMLEQEADSISKILHVHVDAQDTPSKVSQSALVAVNSARRLVDLQQRYSTVIQSECVSAVMLHLRLHILFTSGFLDGPVYDIGISDLCCAANRYLAEVISIADEFRYIRDPRYFPSFLSEMMIAAAFTLLRILNSSYGQYDVPDIQAAKGYFRTAVEAIKATSVTENDLPTRYADVLAQLFMNTGKQAFGESSLQLRVRTRLSQSVVFDSVWRWREVQAGHNEVELQDTNGIPGSLTPEPSNILVSSVPGYVTNSHGDPTLPPLPLPVSLSYGTNFLASANEHDLFDVGWNFDMGSDFNYQGFLMNGSATPIQWP